jgi:hypothetical protein
MPDQPTDEQVINQAIASGHFVLSGEPGPSVGPPRPDEVSPEDLASMVVADATELLRLARQGQPITRRMQSLLSRLSDGLRELGQHEGSWPEVTELLHEVTAWIREEQADAERAFARTAGRVFAAKGSNVAVSIYLRDERIHGQVETAVERWLATAGFSIDARSEPVIGSWFRTMAAGLRQAAKAPDAREALLRSTS